VRCLVRRPEALVRAASTEVVEGDMRDPEAVGAALNGVDCAFYLVHGLGGHGSFVEEDRRAATAFAAAAARADVRRLIYLGGLGAGSDLSAHLASRHEVGRILRGSGVPTVELRASIVIGSGSASFEILRALVDRLPVMITPRWVNVTTQPIAVEDVIAYLVEALDVPLDGTEPIEIGGPERSSYGALMREYARLRGLRRLLIPVPLLTPRLSSLWLTLVTPVHARIGRDLIDSLPHETVVRDDRSRRLFSVRPRGYPEAIERALRNEDRDFAATRWSDALGDRSPPFGGVRFGQRLVDSRSLRVPVPAAQAFAPIRRIGGTTGWYYGNALWRLRGLIDAVAGGVGLRRGRIHPEYLVPGAALDFWRVEAYEPDRLLRLRAEMRLPGRAWLQFEVDDREDGAEIRQTAMFDPVGVAGLAYWYGLFPIHHRIFQGMLGGIRRAALAGAA
jgi:uncharacterized protein YbjT (DUF2867 family)